MISEKAIFYLGVAACEKDSGLEILSTDAEQVSDTDPELPVLYFVFI